ncbi:MAG TPA: MGMT family protein [Nitrososphaeraceae archaeon]|jgi:methylated-DNA-[protein]-cysteine S-methyltransferase|nr:MGMT family protein [Nitrososphaeraceae archaeon]HSL13236.1 MGMT family protein [Nitrososphaeraceae archaeon]
MSKNPKTHLNYNSKKLNSIEDAEKGLVLSSSNIPSKSEEIVTKSVLKNEDVYDLLRKIPAGKVTTYGALAKALGNPSASRIIGRILGQNPNPIKVPCHRVVMSDGKLGGYAYGTAKKRELLEKEGLYFTNGIISDFKNVRVYPSQAQQ